MAGASHGGMQHALEKMKEAVRNGGKYERDSVESIVPLVSLGIVATIIVLVLLVRFF